MARLFSYTITLLAVLGAEPAAGQSALERLERQIRSRLAAPASGAPQVPLDAKPTPPSPAPAKADRHADTREQAYLGAVTVDALDRGRGVRVTEVAPGSPAQAAGIQPGDLLTGLGGVRIRTLEDFDEIMGEVRPGMTLTMEILRGNQPHKVNVTFARRSEPKPPAAAATGGSRPQAGGNKLEAAVPLNGVAGKKPGEAPKPVLPPPPAPQVPPPPPELSKAGAPPEGRPKEVVAGGLPALVPPDKGKPAVPANAASVEARLSALETRIRQLEERIARLEEALRGAAEAKAKP